MLWTQIILSMKVLFVEIEADIILKKHYLYESSLISILQMSSWAFPKVHCQTPS